MRLVIITIVIVIIISSISIIRRGSDLEKQLTMKNCDKTFLKSILRFKKAKKLR